eukprot:TRINITY_DN4592_c0_g1_i1.p1 TRINITY_DN4592_c0_g1~~TRINITY_DN4592_c0_g1_i1.p1  ORF type:complete len:191 (-),score=62.57 TRINITY_DN4592_c0_g1_i1:110-682(-)
MMTASDNEKKGLDRYVKLDVLQKESNEGITFLWNSYFRNKPIITSVFPIQTWNNIKTKISQNCKAFVYPLPREEGYLSVFGQFQLEKNVLTFTFLSTIQSLGTLAVPFLVVEFFTEIADSKGLVLMRGEHKTDVISMAESRFMVNLWQTFLLDDSKQELMKQFNNKPAEFDFGKVVSALEAHLLQEASRK